MAIKFCFWVPDYALEKVKQAIFTKGAGNIGCYSKCCWQTLGQGQFLANAQANPAIGKCGVTEFVKEWKVEVTCSKEAIVSVVQIFKQVHPYETPVYECIEIMDY